MTPQRPLIAFDQSFCLAGHSHAQALRDTLQLAQQCEALGYHRFWVSEHHNNGAIVGTAPEVMLGALTSLTTRMRIGAAGILLPFYQPFKVAEQFRVLEALAPGRIDLGLGRSPGGDPSIFSVLNPHGSSEREGFEVKVAELLRWLGEAGHNDTRALPRTATTALPWMLVTSVAGAHSAARLGLPMCFNYSAEQSRGIEAAVFAAYRASFAPSAFLAQPYTAMMFFALAAASDEEAHYLFSSRALWRIHLDRGQRLPLEPPEVAHVTASNPAHASRIAGQLEINLVGDARHIANRIEHIAGSVGADEIGMTNWTYHMADRITSFRLLKDALS
ncbi:MsnO8 family LLM class oxidoreductase [Herbaspirillum sp. alder98]|uniref:MsnO8 family LLM class oxidoreductase n=1 Tax=Herbaspirillum sp. alder98 TaxID=2913096 RepID=UPI001CD860BD|nr:MsnO8 family LLM class oxidoreductase [Herbaspirillum sp. alder98]MCA1326801.1 MsnO8 family LLM class oxidoreductase [Herbaspirillum sp. alder98]